MSLRTAPAPQALCPSGGTVVTLVGPDGFDTAQVPVCDTAPGDDVQLLNQLICAPGDGVGAVSGRFTCQAAPTLNADDVVRAGASCPTGQVAIGTDGTGGLVCRADADALAAVSCPSGQLLVRGVGGLGCAPDVVGDVAVDTLADLATACADGQVPVATASGFACASVTDADVARDALAGAGCTEGQRLVIDSGGDVACVDLDDKDALRDLACTDGQVVGFDDNGLACVADADTDTDLAAALFAACGNGQTIKFNNGAWACADDLEGGADSDLLGDLVGVCLPGDTVKRGVDGVWRCAADIDTDTDDATALLASCPTGGVVTFDDNGEPVCVAQDAVFVLEGVSCVAGAVVAREIVGDGFTCRPDRDTNTDTLRDLFESCGLGQRPERASIGPGFVCGPDRNGDVVGDLAPTCARN